MSGAHHTIVKVCGITRVEDARAAVEAGADWLGIILMGDSPRRIDVALGRAICAAVDGVPVVAVMVAPTPGEALDLARRAGASRVQLHRVESFAWPESFPLPVTIAVPVDTDGSLSDPLPPERHSVLLDTADTHRAGGTGQTFPWDAARVVAATRPTLLAGGLDASNVAAAIEAVHPFGVDASSRLETSPGFKDHERVRRFVAAVRACHDLPDA